MKSFKQILAITLVLMLSLSATVFTAHAEEFVPSEEPVIYFEVPEDLNNYTAAFCHIWEYGSIEPFASWQSKKERCTQTDTPGVFSYNITAKTGITLEEDTFYCIIFFLDTGFETYTTLFSTDCFGDTVYCNDIFYENPVDSNKTSRAAFWKHQDPLTYGPLCQITSIGNISGTALPPQRTTADIFRDFLLANLENTRIHSGKTDQQIVDSLAEKLQLSNETVAEIIALAGVSVDWTAGGVSSTDEVTPDEPTSDEIVIYGDANLDGDVNIKDATLIQKVTAGLETLEFVQARWCADVNLDGYVNIKDATAIQKYVAGLESEDCIGTETLWEDHFAPIDPVD